MISDILNKHLVFAAALAANALFSFSAFAGNSGGGGNTRSGRAVSYLEIQESIKTVKPTLVLIAQKLNVMNESIAQHPNLAKTAPKELLSAYSKLFPTNDPSAIYRAIKNSKFVPTNGPCYEADGKTEVDGSVATRDGSICMSTTRPTVQRIDRETGETLLPLTDTNMNIQIAGLSFHEVSHKLHLTEKEARLVQNDIIGSLPNNVIAKASTTLKYVERKFDSVLSDLASGKELSESYLLIPPGQNIVMSHQMKSVLCTTFGMILTGAQALQNELSNNPFLSDFFILTLSETHLLNAGNMKAAFLLGACAPDLPLNISGTIFSRPNYSKLAYEDQDQIGMFYLFSKVSQKPPTDAMSKTVYGEWILRNTAKLGVPAAQKEIEDLIVIFNRLKSQIHNRWNL